MDRREPRVITRRELLRGSIFFTGLSLVGAAGILATEPLREGNPIAERPLLEVIVREISGSAFVLGAICAGVGVVGIIARSIYNTPEL